MFAFSLSTPTVLALLGCLLIAWDASKQQGKNPWTVIIGLSCIGAMALLRLFSPAGLFFSLSGAFSDLGIGMWLGAAVLLVRRGKAKPFFTVGLFALAIAGLLLLTGRVFGVGESLTEDQTQGVLVELGPDDTLEEIQPLLDAYSVTAERAFPSVSLDEDEDLAQVYLLKGSWEMLKKIIDYLLRDEENVDAAYWNATVSLAPPDGAWPEASRKPGRSIFANDPLVDRQWALEAIGADAAHEMLSHNTPVRKARVAILDTGVDARHEDIAGIFVDSPGSTDKHGHGTHCAGIAGAATNNELGMASLNWDGAYVEVAGYNALGPDGLGSLESIGQAIIDATDDGADVLSMSLGGYSPIAPKVVSDAVRYALKRNAIVVAAAGNSNQDAKYHMPSNIEGVITVSATDAQGRKASFSNTNMSLARPIAAPGVDIVSLVPGNDYQPKSGTSMATPLVSGLIGVMRALDPDLTADAAYAILKETGTKLSDSNKVGLQINAEAAIATVLSDQPVVALTR
ncbi:MAG: S8 family serine peptidase [Rhodothermales bacterium]|nr:S8 family serine peptidase [Rhodothermales bacterium]